MLPFFLSPPYLIFTSTFVFVTFLQYPFSCVGDIATEFDFGTLTLTSLKLLGDAHLNNGSVRLTRDLPVPNSGAGRAFYSLPVIFRRPSETATASFTTFFSFSVANLNPSSIGGGLTFLISPDTVSPGGPGGQIGLGPGPGFVAVEFDTQMDVEFNDINGNHVGLDLGSMVSDRVTDLGSINVDLKSGYLINAWIEYSGLTHELTVSVSYSNVKPKDPILSIPLDLNQYVHDLMYVGFSGSTQGSTETHSIEWWSFSSSFPAAQSAPPEATLDVPAANSIHQSPPPLISPSGGNLTVKVSKKTGPGTIAGVVTASAFFLAVFGVVLFWLFAKKPRFSRSSGCKLATDIIKMPKEFSYKELKMATKNFDSSKIIGQGAFGTVYKGVLQETGDVVAVKRCSHNGQGKNEFLSELSIIGTLRHRNLVRLQGWCHEKGEILLVYELMPNGSLDKVLYESRMVLPWPHRRKILLGVASALSYLHQECEKLVVHRDVKTSNIMLDEGFNARLGDFGLARQIEHDKSPDATVAAGTMGYLAPEYLLTGRATEKTDVFSFGAVVLELATGRRPIERDRNFAGDRNGNGNLVEWVWGLHREGRMMVAADGRLEGEYVEGEVMRVMLVGLACSHPDPLARPTMRSVVQMLVGEAEVPIVPRTKPSLSFTTSELLLTLQDSVSDCNVLLTISTSSSDDSNLCGGGGGGGEELV